MKNRRLLSSALSLVLAAGILAGCGGSSSAPAPAAQPQTPAPEPKKEQVVNLYSARHYAIDDEIYAEFTKQTGIKVNVVKGNAPELIERLKREGQSTPADLFLTIDGGVLVNAKQAGILQPIKSDTVDQNVPKDLRDKDNHWVAVSKRVRVIVYAKDRVKPDQLSTYEDLASDKWKGKVLIRSSTNMYNQSLVASLIALNGEKAMADWAQGIKNNMARNPEGGDKDQIRAVAAGQGDVAIVNSYYLGQMINAKDADAEIAKKIGIFHPNQQTTGTHINISGIGLAKHSKNQEAAVKLVEFLTSQWAQETFASANYEYPINPKAKLPESLKSWGEFKAQQVEFAKYGEHNALALQLMDKVGWK